jgi:glycosyltransferase involved in cell wall biosynthesis
MLPLAARRSGIDLLHSVANFAPLTGPVPRVVTVHDLIFRRLPDTVPTALRVGTEALVPPAARRARRVITVSEASGADLASELGLDPQRIDVVPNGVAPPAPGADAQRAQAWLAVPAGRPVALCVAGAVAHKNLGALIDALALVPAPERPLLVLAGHGTDGGPLAARARALGVGGDVRCAGAVSQPELEDLYAAASLLVTATRYEGFGLPVLEAMLRGVPVACSDIPVLREVAGDAASFFDPGSPAAIAAALRGVLGGGPAIDRLRERGRERALRYTWAAAAAGTAASYERALRPQRP